MHERCSMLERQYLLKCTALLPRCSLALTTVLILYCICYAFAEATLSSLALSKSPSYSRNTTLSVPLSLASAVTPTATWSNSPSTSVSPSASASVSYSRGRTLFVPSASLSPSFTGTASATFSPTALSKITASRSVTSSLSATGGTFVASTSISSSSEKSRTVTRTRTRPTTVTVTQNCTTVGTTFTTEDTIVNVSCTSVVFANVTTQGTMTLNISITGITLANPVATQIFVTIVNMTVKGGATLAFDSRGYSANSGGPAVSIVIQSLIGNDGSLVFLGSFPPGASILVSNAQMVSSSSSSPMLSSLDPSFSANPKIMMLVNVSLTGNSSLILTGSSLVASVATLSTIAFLIAGAAPLTLSTSSTLAIRTSTVSVASGRGCFIVASSLNFTSNSSMAIVSSTVSGTLNIMRDVTVTSNSSLLLSSCSLTSLAVEALTVNGPLTFSSSSFFALISCSVTPAAFGTGFGIGILTFTSYSYFAFVSCTLQTNARVTFGMSRCAFANYSFMLIASSSFSSTGGSGGAPTFIIYGPSTFTNSSYLAISLSTFSSAASTFVMSLDTIFTIRSYLALSSCTLTVGGGTYGNAFHINGAATFTNSSYMTVSSCTISTSNGHAFYIGGVITSAGSSYVSVASSTMTSSTGGYGYLMGSLEFSTFSYLTIISCTMTAAGGCGLVIGNPTFTNSSYMKISACKISATGSRVNGLQISALSFAHYSYLTIESSSMGANGGSSDAFWMRSLSFANNSYFNVTSCTMTGGGWESFYVDGAATFTGYSYMSVSWCAMTCYGYAFEIFGNSFFTNNSSLVLTSCSITSTAHHAFLMDNSLTFTNSSYMMLILCNMTGPASAAFLVNGVATFTGSSFLLFSSCNMNGFLQMAVVIFTLNSSLVLNSVNLPVFSTYSGTFSSSSFLALSSCKMSRVLISACSFSGSSYLAIGLCSLSDSFTLGAAVTSIVAFTSSSYLALSSCNITSAAGNAFVVNGATTFTSNSFLTLSSCITASPIAGAAFQLSDATTFSSYSYLVISDCKMTAAENALIATNLVSFSAYSYFVVSSCTMISSGGAVGNAFALNSTFTNYSYLVVTSCAMSSNDRVFYANKLTVNGWSYVLVANSSFISKVSVLNAPVTLGRNSPLIIGNNSMMLWKGNVMQSLAGYSCISSAINFSAASATSGTVSIVDNECTCGAGCLMFNASSAFGGVGGTVYQRCNKVNGVDVSSGSALLPTGMISVGSCGLCDATADCFGPLTLSNSTCTLNTSSSANAAICVCLRGGVRRNMCLPGMEAETATDSASMSIDAQTATATTSNSYSNFRTITVSPSFSQNETRGTFVVSTSISSTESSNRSNTASTTRSARPSQSKTHTLSRASTTKTAPISSSKSHAFTSSRSFTRTRNSVTASRTPLGSLTASATGTSPVSVSVVTKSLSCSVWSTGSASRTGSTTDSHSHTLTTLASLSFSIDYSFSAGTRSTSVTPERSQTFSSTVSSTSFQTDSASLEVSATETESESQSVASATLILTMSSSLSPTRSFSPAQSITNSWSGSRTASRTLPATKTLTLKPTVTSSMSATATKSTSLSVASSTLILTMSSSLSPTRSFSPAQSITNSWSGSRTASRTLPATKTLTLKPTVTSSMSASESISLIVDLINGPGVPRAAKLFLPNALFLHPDKFSRRIVFHAHSWRRNVTLLLALPQQDVPDTYELRYQHSVTGNFDYARLQVDSPGGGVNWTCRGLANYPFSLTGCFALVNCDPEVTWFPVRKLSSQPAAAHDVLRFTLGPLAFENLNCLSPSSVVSSFVVVTTYPIVTVPRYRAAVLTPDLVSSASLLLPSAGRGGKIADELLRIANGSAVLTQMRLLQDEQQALSTEIPHVQRESPTEGSTAFYHCTVSDVTSFAGRFVRSSDDLGQNFSTSCKQTFAHVEDAQVYCTGDEQCLGYVTGYGADGSETAFCLLYPGLGVDGSADIDPRLVYVKTTPADRTCTFTIDSSAFVRVYIQQTFLSGSFVTVTANQNSELASCGQLMPFLGGQLGRSSQCDVYSSCYSGLVDGGSLISVTADATMAQGGCVNSLGVILEVVFPFQSANASTPSPEIRKSLAAVPRAGLGFTVVGRDSAYFYVTGASHYVLLLYQTGFNCRGSSDAACLAPLVNISAWNVDTDASGIADPLQSCGGSLPFLFNNSGLSNQRLTSFFCGFPFSASTGEEDVNAPVIAGTGAQYAMSISPVEGRVGSAAGRSGWIKLETSIAALGRLSKGQSAKLVGTLFVQLNDTDRNQQLGGFVLHGAVGSSFSPLLLLPSGISPSVLLNSSDLHTQLLPTIGSIFSGPEIYFDAFLVNWSQLHPGHMLPPSLQLGCVMDWISDSSATCEIPVSPKSNFLIVSVAQTFMIPSAVKITVEYLDAGGGIVETATCGGSIGFTGILSRNDQCTTYLPCTAGFVQYAVEMVRITVPQSVAGGGTCMQAFSALVEADWKAPPTLPPAAAFGFSDQYLCVADRQYILVAQLCDGVSDCIDGADEEQCEDWHLVETNFTYPTNNATTVVKVAHAFECVARGIAAGTTAVAVLGTTCKIFGATYATQLVSEPNRAVVAAVGYVVFAYLPKGATYPRCSRMLTCSNNGEVTITGGGSSCACLCDSSYGGNDCSQPLDMSFVGPVRVSFLPEIVLSPAEVDIAVVNAAPFPVKAACSAFSTMLFNSSTVVVFSDCTITGAADSVSAFHTLAGVPAVLVAKLNERLGGVVVSVGIATAPVAQPIFGCEANGNGVACSLAKTAPVDALSLSITASTPVENAIVQLQIKGVDGAGRRRSDTRLELRCTVGNNSFVTTDLSGCHITVCRLPLEGTAVSRIFVNTTHIDRVAAVQDDPCFSPYTASVVYSLGVTALEPPLQVINTFADFTPVLHASVVMLILAGVLYLASVLFKLLHLKYDQLAVNELLRTAEMSGTSSISLLVPVLRLVGYSSSTMGKLKAELWSVGALIIALDVTIAGIFVVILFFTSSGYNSNVEVVMEHYRDGLCSASATAPTPGQSWLFNSRTARDCVRRPTTGTSFGTLPIFGAAYCDMDASVLVIANSEAFVWSLRSVLIALSADFRCWVYPAIMYAYYHVEPRSIRQQQEHKSAALHHEYRQLNRVISELKTFLAQSRSSGGKVDDKAFSFEQYRLCVLWSWTRAWNMHGRKYLVPAADMFNHEPDDDEREFTSRKLPSSSYRSSKFTDTHELTSKKVFVVRSDRTIVLNTQQNDKQVPQIQIHESYGDNVNDIFFNFHGFVPRTNRYDCQPIMLEARSKKHDHHRVRSMLNGLRHAAEQARLPDGSYAILGQTICVYHDAVPPTLLQLAFAEAIAQRSRENPDHMQDHEDSQAQSSECVATAIRQFRQQLGPAPALLIGYRVLHALVRCSWLKFDLSGEQKGPSTSFEDRTLFRHVLQRVADIAKGRQGELQQGDDHDDSAQLLDVLVLCKTAVNITRSIVLGQYKSEFSTSNATLVEEMLADAEGLASEGRTLNWANRTIFDRRVAALRLRLQRMKILNRLLAWSKSAYRRLADAELTLRQPDSEQKEEL